MKITPLCIENLSKIDLKNGLLKPEDEVFGYPEKIISFGTGVLLKGLPYYFVNKANNQGIFKGRILAVKSTPGTAEIESLANQDFLYSLQSSGIQNNEEVIETNIMAPISRILHAETHWDEILKAAHSVDLQVIISNTTEIGLNFPAINDIENFPPQSFPGKLLMFLQERFKAFNGSNESGLVIIPTELVVNNGEVLKEVILKLAAENSLSATFIDWLQNSNQFCNSLVDRIVTGKPDAAKFEKFEADFGFKDANLISSETYRLWAIQGDESIQGKLSFSKADEGCVIAQNIDQFRELKLRLLNGSHSLMVGFSFLKGIKTVKESLDNEAVENFMNSFIFGEIIPSLSIDESISRPYAMDVLDRFRNPNIEHKLLGITVQYSTKIKARVVPIILNYYKKFDQIPHNLTIGFAYFLKFMKVAKVENDQYFGFANDEYYPIQDLNAKLFADLSLHKSDEEYVHSILKNNDLWGADLQGMEGIEEQILSNF
ncbi:MAG: tagaturonate reductase [Bacteroidota bacterium]